MSGVDWGLGVAPDVGGTFMNAYNQGREQRRVEDGRNALAAYAQNPNDTTLNALAPHAPEYVIKRREEMAKVQREAEEKQLIGAALNGDAAARQKLAYVNSDEYIKLNDRTKKAVDAGMDAIAQQAFTILQLPEAQRPAAFQQALANMKAQGVNVGSFRLSGDVTQDLKTALAMAGKLEAFEQFAQPKYTPIGEAGLAGFQFGKPIQQGGQPQNFAPGPQPGSVVGGYRFKGGNPNDRNSWEQVGGGASNGTGGFRP